MRSRRFRRLMWLFSQALKADTTRVRLKPDSTYNRRIPRRLREVGAKPRRSRHCKRPRFAGCRFLVLVPGPGPRSATELRLGKAREADSRRESGNLTPGASNSTARETPQGGPRVNPSRDP